MKETYSREELKQLFREGLSNELLENDPDIATSFREGLERTITGHIFPNDPVQYFIAQAIEVKSPLLIYNHSGFTHTLFNGYHTSPVSAETLLINNIDEGGLVIIKASSENIILKIPFPCGLKDTLEKKRFSLEKLEIDIYCDTQNNSKKQEAFLQLLQGCWPEELALPDQSMEYWPKLGVRPPIDSSTIDIDSQVSRLINFIKHPFEPRFLRLPLYHLLNNWNKFKDGIHISVNDSTTAKNIKKHLEGSIKLNCVLFWNQAIGISDRQEYLKTNDNDDDQKTSIRSISIDFGSRLYDGGIVAVLDCIDKQQEVDNHFYDRRWAFGIEPEKLFSVRRDDSNHRSFYIDFLNPKDWHDAPNLFLRFIMSERWKGLHQNLKNSSKSFKEVLSIGDLPTFSMIEPPVSDNLAGWGEREQTISLLWLANGVGDFPFPQQAVVTRTQLARLLLQLIPKPLAGEDIDKQALKIKDFEFSQVIESGHAHWGNSVVTKIIIKKDFGIDKKKVDYYLEWLKRAAQPFCPAGTLLDIKAIEEES